MTNTKNHRKSRILLLLLFISLSSCLTTRSNKSLYKPDDVYIELSKEAGVNTKKFKRKEFNCETQNLANDSTLIRQNYSQDVHFEGYIVNGNKIGIWKGYCKSILIAEIGYLGESENRVVYIKLWGIDGHFIKERNLSMIK